MSTLRKTRSAAAVRPDGFVRVAALVEIPLQGAIAVEIDGEPVAVVRTHGGVYAIHDVCSHAEVPLSQGDVSGATIECWLHGSRFDLCTGRPIGAPATRPVPVYPVQVRDGDVYVSTAPCPARLQPAAVPPTEN
jgi:3-phenylpropionate/trans-cinnamate dioxygenase ferredoxin subunit